MTSMVTDFKKNQKKGVSGDIVFKLGAVLIVVFVILLLVADIKIYKKKQQLNVQIESLRNKISDLEKEKASLQEGIDKVDDQEYIEKVAREELNLQKPGETVVSFVKEEKEITNESQENKRGLNAWLGWIGNIFR